MISFPNKLRTVKDYIALQHDRIDVSWQTVAKRIGCTKGNIYAMLRGSIPRHALRERINNLFDMAYQSFCYWADDENYDHLFEPLGNNYNIVSNRGTILTSEERRFIKTFLKSHYTTKIGAVIETDIAASATAARFKWHRPPEDLSIAFY